MQVVALDAAPAALRNLSAHPERQRQEKRASANHRADIQGLRALAVLLVVAFHAGLKLRGGFVGVDVFFVISGFVITAMILRELEEGGTLRLRRFYARRASRLLPALATVLIVIGLASFFFLSPLEGQRAASRTGIASSLFSANAVLYKAPAGYFSLSSESNPLLHMWSLAVEEQFYFVFPGLLLVLWKVSSRIAPRRSARTVSGILLLVGTLIGFAFSLWATGANERFAFYASPARAWEFSVGAVLAIFARHWEDSAGGSQSPLDFSASFSFAWLHRISPQRHRCRGLQRSFRSSAPLW